MEEMNNLVEVPVTEIVEGAAEKITFKENLYAYGMAGVFAVGVVTTGYLTYKGVKALSNKIKKNVKGEMEEAKNESVADVEEDIQDSGDGSEEN